MIGKVVNAASLLIMFSVMEQNLGSVLCDGEMKRRCEIKAANWERNKKVMSNGIWWNVGDQFHYVEPDVQCFHIQFTCHWKKRWETLVSANSHSLYNEVLTSMSILSKVL